MKEYGLYDVKDYETCVYFGTVKEIAKFLNCKTASIYCHITRKKRGFINLLKHKYDLIEIQDIDEKQYERISIKKSNQEIFKEALLSFTELEKLTTVDEELKKFKVFDEFKWELKGRIDKVMGHEEKWKQIPEFQYSISNYGRIRNDKNKKIKESRYKNYMLVVDLYKNSKRFTMNVVRMEANLFLRPLFKNERVRHKDNDSRNNYIGNLEIIKIGGKR